MSTTAVTMTPERARAFRAAYDATALWLDRMSLPGLRRENAIALAGCGRARLFGKPSRDELARELMDLLGFTIGRLNEATHVTAHADETWPDCPHCAGSAS